MRDQGLVDIAEQDSSIAVRLVYATPYNFMGKRLYHGLTKAFMLPETAGMLIDAKNRLKAIRPDLNLLVYDAARPLSVQREMWDMVKGTAMKDFVANPNNGPGMHNFGAAVDLTLDGLHRTTAADGIVLRLFRRRSAHYRRAAVARLGAYHPAGTGKPTAAAPGNDRSGLHDHLREWWHFNIMPTAEARKILTPID